jgi:hypothetical protein
MKKKFAYTLWTKDDAGNRVSSSEVKYVDAVNKTQARELIAAHIGPKDYGVQEIDVVPFSGE